MTNNTSKTYFSNTANKQRLETENSKLMIQIAAKKSELSRFISEKRRLTGQLNRLKLEMESRKKSPTDIDSKLKICQIDSQKKQDEILKQTTAVTKNTATLRKINFDKGVVENSLKENKNKLAEIQNLINNQMRELQQLTDSQVKLSNDSRKVGDQGKKLEKELALIQKDIKKHELDLQNMKNAESESKKKEEQYSLRIKNFETDIYKYEKAIDDMNRKLQQNTRELDSIKK